MILNEPEAQCPFCRGFMPGWRSAFPAKACDLCDRPLFLLPSLFRPDRLAILSAIDVVKVATLPVVAAAMISFGIGGMEADSFAQVVAGTLLTWGVIDVWDGTAGLNTGIDRVKRQLKHGYRARKMSIAKTIFGMSSVLLGGAGLLLVN